ncbi:jg17913, partial [Pararge aegeria aegeria]
LFTLALEVLIQTIAGTVFRTLALALWIGNVDKGVLYELIECPSNRMPRSRRLAVLTVEQRAADGLR